MQTILNETEASERIGLSVSTLQKYRVAGTGPRFIKLGAKRIAYRLSDIEEWIDSRVVRSTSEKVAA